MFLSRFVNLPPPPIHSHFSFFKLTSVKFNRIRKPVIFRNWSIIYFLLCETFVKLGELAEFNYRSGTVNSKSFIGKVLL